MCNLYRLKVRRWELVEYFQAEDNWRKEVELDKDYVAPGRDGFVCREQDGARVLEPMAWGWRNPAGGKPLVNVRNLTSKLWRPALESPAQRCLVPATAFQEWTVEPDPATGKKRAFDFSVPSRPIFAMAGIWRPTETGAVYAFLTCGYDGDPSTHIVGAVHPKAIPVILHHEDFDRWLQAPVDEVLPLACAYPSQLMAIA